MKLFNVLMLQNIHSITFYSSLKFVGFLIDKFYIQTVPGTKHHRFLVSLIFLLHLLFFRHNKRLRRVEHLQRKGALSFEPYFSCVVHGLNTTTQYDFINKIPHQCDLIKYILKICTCGNCTSRGPPVFSKAAIMQS